MTRIAFAFVLALALGFAAVALIDYHAHRARAVDALNALRANRSCIDASWEVVDGLTVKRQPPRDCQAEWRAAMDASRAAHVPYLFAFGDSL